MVDILYERYLIVARSPGLSSKFRPSVRASKDILHTRLDLVWRASVFACKITLRAPGLKAEQPPDQARLRR